MFIIFKFNICMLYDVSNLYRGRMYIIPLFYINNLLMFLILYNIFVLKF